VNRSLKPAIQAQERHNGSFAKVLLVLEYLVEQLPTHSLALRQTWHEEEKPAMVSATELVAYY
jgi:hypothetical protein